MRLRSGSPARSAAAAAWILPLALLSSAIVVSSEKENGVRHAFIHRDRPSLRGPTPPSPSSPEPVREEEAPLEVEVERGCPYALDSEEEAIFRMKDPSLPGNVVKVEHLEFCRTGNHFSSFFRNLALGYCCKSKVVWLPPKDDVLAPGVFNAGTPGPRWFDFSSAPDMPGFDSSACSADITWAGQRAFHMHQIEDPNHDYHIPGLMECIAKAPRLLGCEAAYYFPRDIDVCSTPAAAAAGVASAGASWAGGGHIKGEVESGKKWRGGRARGDELERRTLDGEAAAGDADDEEEGAGGAVRWREGGAVGGKGGEGTLVLHVRSGDIFDDAILSYYGQPPLQFYLHAIHHGNWDQVDIVTYAPDEASLNPVVPALREKLESGEISGNINIHTDRSMGEDLLSMVCADGLALARSTLVSLTGFHTRAKRVYGPIQCNSQLKQLALYRPGVQAYGLIWPGKYDVYQNWENTVDQRREMLAYDMIDGFEQCDPPGSRASHEGGDVD